MHNKFLKYLSLAVALLFTAVLAGGDVLHEHIHHHDSRTSYEACPVFLVQHLPVDAFVVVATVVFLDYVYSLGSDRQVVFRAFLISFLLRAPPAAV
jgi:hypothetical protein